ncbi:MAG TPA: sterol desaturase family protein [Nitrospiraceae bacterium]|nr:sterol desaturase family protein [Nitrospiraceae bacterium]
MSHRWPLVLGAAVLLAWAERRRPLRRRIDPGPARIMRNLAVAAVSAIAVQAVERPITARVTAWTEQRGWGILGRLSDRSSIRTVLSLLLLDYSLYVWHVLTHRVPQLWRMHIVHHIDLDLDMTTALRFHVAEMLVSTWWRLGQILLIGVSSRTLALWQTLTILSVLFHHSNCRLPLQTERWLSLVLVTPRMHGIHHSIVESEVNSNWSSGLTMWDRLHGTLKVDVPQDAIVIGVPEYRCPEDVGLERMLALPFAGVQRDRNSSCRDTPSPTMRYPYDRPKREKSHIGV